MSDSDSDETQKAIADYLRVLTSNKSDKYKVLLDLETWLIKEG